MKIYPLYYSIVFTASAVVLHADSRSSADYTVTTDTLDVAGQSTSGGLYSHGGSMGGITGVATVGSPVQIAKSGYFGQLYEVTAFEVTAASSVIHETATLQLGGSQVLDDGSKLAIHPAEVSWAVGSGPLIEVNSSGLVTADVVDRDMRSTVGGTYLGLSNTYRLAVLDTIFDNYGSYAGDGLGDDWQVEYFGYDNPDAAPTADPDGDSQDNLFEYTAGLVPTNANSVFTVQLAAVSGQPTQRAIVFEPTVSGRSYTVKTREFLDTGAWLPLAASITTSAGLKRTVTDTSASDDTKFYIVEIVRD